MSFECACMACGSIFQDVHAVCPECQSTDLVDEQEYQQLVDGASDDFGD